MSAFSPGRRTIGRGLSLLTLGLMAFSFQAEARTPSFLEVVTKPTISSPYGIAIDKRKGLFQSNSVIISDPDQNQVFSVSLDGTIELIAGNGTACPNETDPCGEGGRAIEASLGSPMAVDVTPGGRILIAEQTTNKIRAVDTNGIITTVAGTGEWGDEGDGGKAVEAHLASPLGVFASSDGGFVIGGERVRHVDRYGIINTIAGGGKTSLSATPVDALGAQLGAIGGISQTADGGLLLSDPLENQVLQLDWSWHTVRRIAGTGQEGFNGERGLALATHIGAPLAAFQTNTGEVVVADHQNGRLRLVSGDGLSTIVGPQGVLAHDHTANPSADWTPIGRIALAPNGGVWVTEPKASRIRFLPPAWRQELDLPELDHNSGHSGHSDHGRHSLKPIAEPKNKFAIELRRPKRAQIVTVKLDRAAEITISVVGLGRHRKNGGIELPQLRTSLTRYVPLPTTARFDMSCFADGVYRVEVTARSESGLLVATTRTIRLKTPAHHRKRRATARIK